MVKKKSKNTIKLAVGYVLIGISLILFILSCIPNFAVSNFFKGSFGVAWYAYLVIAMLFGIANILNLKYVFNKRFTICVCFAMFSLISILHVIFTHSALVGYDGFANFSNYVHYCFSLNNGITVGGACFGAIVYFFKTIFGIVGVYATFIMLLAIFSGIVLDSLIYGTNKAKKVQNLNFKTADEQPETVYQNIETQADYVNINQGKMESSVGEQNEDLSFDSDDENNNYFEQSAQSAEKIAARERLFPGKDFSGYSARPVGQNQSARDILFGQRDIPDVTLANDAQRDRWMRNTEKELKQKEPGLIIDDEIDDIFGNTSFDTDFSANSTDLYTRGFGVRQTINNDDDEDMDQNNSRFGSLRNSRLNRIEDNFDDFGDRRLGTNRTFGSSNMFGDSGFGKLGEDTEDLAKSKEIDFGLGASTKTGSARSASKVQGKQMGIKSVRYNSIPLSIFKVYKEANADYSEEYRRKSAALEKVMSDFRIGAKVINVVRGPKVTRYELTLPDGVSVNRVLSIETDIAIAIEAKSKIRIEPHIPGKKAFGIELANDNPSTVGMRELLESPEFTNTSHPLPIAIGKDIDGSVIIKSLPKMIHLLVRLVVVNLCLFIA